MRQLDYCPSGDATVLRVDLTCHADHDVYGTGNFDGQSIADGNFLAPSRTDRLTFVFLGIFISGKQNQSE